jgi:nucleotide sugar dehydrogenase
MEKSIAVIGQGFVGGSLTTVFSERGFNVYAYDKSGKYVKGALPSHGDVAAGYPSSISELVHDNELGATPDFSGVYFVCVPTPMRADGSADLSIVEGVLDELSKEPGGRVAVVKSTIPPGSTESWNKKYESTGLRVVFNPEFLTEANALDDMRNQNRIILGGPRPWINQVKQVFQTAFPNVPLVKTSSTTAEMVKYLTNNFLTVKVAFANEMHQICQSLEKTGLNVDYDKVVEYAKYDERLGSSHWAVPGPDGKFGYSGSCFPKDINAMIFVGDRLHVDTPVLDGAWKKNLEVRPERDWEKLVGRAVSKKE